MYTEYYNLKYKPFQISSDPAFMWFGEKHKEALATLKYGILDNKGFLLLTGDVGTGKTSLINTLVQNIGEDIICTSVPDPSLGKIDFFNYIAAAFGIDKEFNSKGSFLVHFRNFLVNANKNKKKVLLIIDEAQLLTQDILEEIRLLSNIEKSDTKLINIFFIGQNEFNEILNRPQNRAVRQRMTLNYNLDPLTPDETGAYIQHRLKVAGTTEKLFDEGAVQEIYLYSGGFPRRINIICDHSLLSGFVKELKTIDAGIVKECAKELKIPAFVRNRDINGFKKNISPEIGKKYQDNQSIKPQYNTGPHPQAQSSPDQPIQRRRFPWMEIIVFLFFVMFAWYFMFPHEFSRSMSDIRYESRQGMIKVKEAVFGIPENEVGKYRTKSVLESKKKQDIDGRLLNSEKMDNEKKQYNNKEVPESNNSRIYSVPKSDIEVLKKEDISSKFEEPSINQQENISKTILTANNAVNKTGEPEPVIEITDGQENILIAPKKKTESILPLPDKKVVIRFQYNTNDFTEKGLEELEFFAQALVMHPESRILITGHTDSQGYSKYNLKLSEFRANIVKSYLLGKGVSDNQINIKGVGGKYPVEKNDTAWGRKMNRRVEIEVIKY